MKAWAGMVPRGLEPSGMRVGSFEQVSLTHKHSAPWQGGQGNFWMGIWEDKLDLRQVAVMETVACSINFFFFFYFSKKRGPPECSRFILDELDQLPAVAEGMDYREPCPLLWHFRTDSSFLHLSGALAAEDLPPGFVLFWNCPWLKRAMSYKIMPPLQSLGDVDGEQFTEVSALSWFRVTLERPL